MSLKINPTFLLTVVFAMVLSVTCTQTAMSQVGEFDPTGSGGQIDPTQIDSGVVQEANNQGSGGTTTQQSSGGVGELGDAISIDVTPDQRNQGFVGASADEIAGGFVGRPDLADGASFGGGVNDAGRSNINIGASGAGVGGTGNGFTVSRRNVRARMRPSFFAPRFSDEQVVKRFEGHFALQPGSQDLQGDFSITVKDRTAFLKGTVASPAESERLVRQLRLEPGVYNIVNELQISN